MLLPLAARGVASWARGQSMSWLASKDYSLLDWALTTVCRDCHQRQVSSHPGVPPLLTASHRMFTLACGHGGIRRLHRNPVRLSLHKFQDPVYTNSNIFCHV